MDQTVSVNLFNYILIIGENEVFMMDPLFLVSWVKKPLCGNPNGLQKSVWSRGLRLLTAQLSSASRFMLSPNLA